MTPRPTVSVVMPCFNDGRYLQDAIESVNSQTYESWEILLVNDGSTDPYTCQLLSKLNHPKVRIFHTDRQGPSSARNLAIKNAAGKYILPLDADDKIAQTYVQKAVAVLENDADTEIVYCKAKFFGLLQGNWNLPPYDPQLFVLQNMIFATAMYRKSSWERVGGYSPNMRNGMEDYDFWIKLLASGGKVYRIEEPLFFYRVKRNSRTATLKRDARKLEQESYQTLFENNIDFFSRPSSVRVIFNALRYSWVRQNAIQSSFLWRYCFRYLTNFEVLLQQYIKRLLGRA